MIIKVLPGCWVDPAEVVLIEARPKFDEVIIHLMNKTGFPDRAYIGTNGKSAIVVADEIGLTIERALKM